MVVYELLLTVNDELSVVWRQKLNITSLVYLVLRMTLVLQVVYGLLPAWIIPATTDVSCWGVQVTGTILQFWAYFLTSAFSALRTWAISDRSYVLATIVLLLGIVPIPTNVYGYAVSTNIPSPLSYCNLVPMISARMSLMLLITRISVIVSDAVVLLVTLVKAYRGALEARRVHSEGSPQSLFECIIQNGALYFIALLGANVLRIAFEFTQGWGSVANGMLDYLPLILACRFIVNLRRVATVRNDTSEDRYSSIQFAVPASRLGNIGEILSTSEDAEIPDESSSEHLPIDGVMGS
ncbi:hypothetical protein PsYK624_108380 [Phanerochaete sordida]|uniref:DUF6533 domain-containing protein n=1 Tax=Phanerochaete sordida TaxID=48140 RepID=A0A9P3GGS6_9APHY|nr:hypothetical protein PsYK624_108380 [Phanerochaete sordida]